MSTNEHLFRAGINDLRPKFFRAGGFSFLFGFFKKILCENLLFTRNDMLLHHFQSNVLLKEYFGRKIFQMQLGFLFCQTDDVCFLFFVSWASKEKF